MLPENKSYIQLLEDKLHQLTMEYHQGIVNGRTFEELYTIVRSINAIKAEIIELQTQWQKNN